MSDGVDKMPSTRLFDGDLKLIMIMMEKLEHQIGNLGHGLTAIASEVHSLSDTRSVLPEPSRSQPAVVQAPSPRPIHPPAGPRLPAPVFPAVRRCVQIPSSNVPGLGAITTLCAVNRDDIET